MKARSTHDVDGDGEIAQPVAWIEIVLAILVVVAVVRMFVPIF